LDESDRDAVAIEVKALANGEKSKFQAARRFLIREGQVLWAHTTMALIRNDEGHADHLVVLLEKAGEPT